MGRISMPETRETGEEGIGVGDDREGDCGYESALFEAGMIRILDTVAETSWTRWTILTTSFS
jgi:hypothetical protein